MLNWLRRYYHTRPSDPKTGLPNFGVVESGAIYRSGAPSDRVLERAREVYGIRTVLDLRFHDARTELPASIASKVALRRAALDDLGDVDTKMVEACAQIIAAAANHPILVHCAGGRDRTGAVVACFRVLYQHWLPAYANTEAQSFGLWGDARHRDWANYVRDLGV